MRRIGLYIAVLIATAFGCSFAAAAPVVSVTVEAGDPVTYDSFDEAWTYAMSRQSATIKLLDNITRTQTINYRPTVANGRHTLDLNNFTITDNTTDRMLTINKEDAKLTITDGSLTQGGCLYKRQESDVNIYVVVVYLGEIELAGGNIYCENTIDDPDDENWHPAVAMNNNSLGTAVIRITGGKIEAVSKHTAYAIAGYNSVYITGGNLCATVTKYKNARALSQQKGTAYIDGGTFEAYAKGTGISAFTVCATAWVDTVSGAAQDGEVYITGGTFIAETETNNACAVRSDANVIKVNSGDIVKAHGTMHVSGGTYIVRAPNPSATQVFAVVSNGSRYFDNATPHHMIEESLGIVNISGGDFTVDTRDSEGKYVDNGDNIDLLRNWGTLNVSGGTFTIYQHNGATGIGCYRNKVTVTGNPIFNIHGARNTRGVLAGPWNHASYCDADASKNKAEIEIFGGTFTLVSDSANVDGIYGNSIAAWAYGGLSTASSSGDAGYAMQATVTIHDGRFTAIHPNTGAAYALRQGATATGAYGTAQAKMIVYDGKFQVLAGTESENTPTGTNISSPEEMEYLAGGYYVNYSQLATHINDNCKIRRLTDADPQYAEGYRFTVEIGDPVAKLTVGSVDRIYSSFMRPFNHARQHTEATITLLGDIDYIGENLYYSTAPDNASTTLDLNGHTLMMNELTSTFCIIDKDNATFTIKDSGTGGVFGITYSTYYGYLLVLRKGKVILEGGTLSSENTATGMYAIYVQANGTNDALLEMKGGKIRAASKANTYALLAKSTSSAASLAVISGGEIEASSTGNYAFPITAAAGGKITINTNNPKLSAMGTIYEAQAVRVEASGTVDINGGRFYSAKGRVVFSATDGSLNIRGGFYNEISMSDEKFRNQVEDHCVPPYHTFPTTPAEQTTYGADYIWKVEPLPESGDYVDIIDVDNTNKTLTLNVSDWAIDGWPYNINRAPFNKTNRTSLRTMTIPYKGIPGDDFYILLKNKDGDIIGHHRYVIPEEIKTATTLAADVARPLFVKGTTLTVNADISTQNIYVGSDATLCVNSGRNLSAENVFLRTTPQKTAQLVKRGTIDASTKVYYTRIATSKAGYDQFGLPLTCLTPINAVRLSNGVNPDYKAGSGWILRSYDEPSRAINGPSEEGANWRTPDGTAIISGGKGYEMYSGVNYYREYYFPVDISALTNQVAVTHTDGAPKDAGWNLLVSPLTYTYTNTVSPEGLAVSWLMPDGTFEQEIPASIPPVTAFAYQAPATGVLSFAGTSIASSMPRRMAADEQVQIQWIHLDVKDANGVGDQTSIYSHPSRYEQNYQTGIDVAKQSLTASRAIIYSVPAYGEMAFAGVADSLMEQGVALTVYSPMEQPLTVSMRENEWLDRMANVWLVDHQAGTRTDLLTGDYTFDAPAGTMAGRFTIQGAFRAPGVMTGNGNVQSDDVQCTKARKVLMDHRMYIEVNGRLYDATGKLITAR